MNDIVVDDRYVARLIEFSCVLWILIMWLFDSVDPISRLVI